MYSEVYISKKTSFLVILITVTAAFCLLSVPVWIGWETFKGIYELAVLIAAAVVVFLYIRRRFYEYTYTINEDIISVKLKIGSKETTVCQVRLEDIIKITADVKIKQLKKSENVKTVLRCNGDLFGGSGTCIIYYDIEKGSNSALLFRPSDKFTEILQNKRIDNSDKL
jgi:hypothetical protein